MKADRRAKSYAYPDRDADRLLRADDDLLDVLSRGLRTKRQDWERRAAGFTSESGV